MPSALNPGRRTRMPGFSALWILTLTIGGCGGAEQSDRLEFVGRDACRPCHEEAVDRFTGSDHDLAMDHATDSTVLGDFNEARFVHHDLVSVFRKREGRFFVLTEGESGRLEEFEVRYVFGVRPLQQYLVEFPDGKIQCLPLCWDTRPVEEGGQRWFHIYGEERIPPNDPLFWTRTAQRWNYMCAECHSTNVRKNFDLENGNYRTTWSEIDVSCEACHGPASRHLLWASGKDDDRVDSKHGVGFEIQLRRNSADNWRFQDGKNTALPVSVHGSTEGVDLCSRCHSRRSMLSEDFAYGKSLLNTHYPAVLRDDLYHADGQILDEVYEYGSFLQSKMYSKGVECIDCHDAHTGKVYADGNALCFRCHKAEVFGGPSHHRHKEESTGTACVECHMPTATYMQVDQRRDHSFRIPRPDLSAKLGTPDACTKCHTDETALWAAGHVSTWYGERHERHYGETFSDARRGAPVAKPEILAMVATDSVPAIIRATAATLLSQFPSRQTVEAARRALRDPDPLVRVSALGALEMIPPDDRVRDVIPLLHDSIRVVRTFAARALAGVSENILTEAENGLWREVLFEFEESQTLNADFPSNLLNLANLYQELGDDGRAEAALNRALQIEPAFIPAYANLADFYREHDREAEVRKTLEAALAVDSSAASIHYALGLHYVRTGDQARAIDGLRRAADREPGNPRFAYGYAVALNSSGQSDLALAVLLESLRRNPYSTDLLEFLALLHRDRGEVEAALSYAVRLREIDPENSQFAGLERLLRESQ